MMRPYVDLGCGSCGVAAGRGMGAILPMQSGMESGVVLVPLAGVELADTLITSGAVLAAMDDVLAHAQHLNGDIQANLAQIMQGAAGQRFYNDWITWYAQYQRFYSTHRGTIGSVISYFGGETVAELRNQAAEYNNFEGRYSSITGHDPSYNPEGSGSQILPTEAWIGIGIGAGIIALALVAWTASSVSKVAAPVARSLNGRKRR